MQNIKYKSLIVFSITILFGALSFAQTTIAVLDFEGKGVSANESSALSDRLRNELTQTGDFTVVERNQMEELLGEQRLHH